MQNKQKTIDALCLESAEQVKFLPPVLWFHCLPQNVFFFHSGATFLQSLWFVWCLEFVGFPLMRLNAWIYTMQAPSSNKSYSLALCWKKLMVFLL